MLAPEPQSYGCCPSGDWRMPLVPRFYGESTFEASGVELFPGLANEAVYDRRMKIAFKGECGWHGSF